MKTARTKEGEFKQVALILESRDEIDQLGGLFSHSCRFMDHINAISWWVYLQNYWNAEQINFYYNKLKNI
jgi:hypothetical protein